MKRLMLIALSSIAFVGCTSPQEIKAIAEGNLLRYAAGVNMAPGTCVGSDSDGDGYVSCSATDKRGDVQTVLCSSQAGVGCKPYVAPVDD